MTSSCDFKFDSCRNDMCLNNSTCLSRNFNEPYFSTSGLRQVCNCSSISPTQMGPRCQGLKRTFKKNGGFVVDMTTQRMNCSSRALPWNISFEYILPIAAKDAKDGTLLLISDFANPPKSIAVGLNNGKPYLMTGNLNRTIETITALNVWHMLDVIITDKNTSLLLNRCAIRLGNRKPCSVAIDGAPLFNPENVKRLVVGGSPPLSTINVPNFSGCIKNVKINSEILSLYDQNKPEDNECTAEDTSCQNPMGSESKTPCGNNGFCTGRLTDVPLGQCICYPGFYNEEPGPPCSRRTMSMYFKSDHSALWEFTPKLWQDRRGENSRKILPISLRFRTVVPTATLMNVKGLTNINDVTQGDFIVSIGIKQGKLQSSIKIDGHSWSLALEGLSVNVSDGKWHSVAYLVRGPTMQLGMDTAEGENFRILHNLPLITQNIEIDTVQRITVGHAAYDAEIHNPLPPPNTFIGCIDDIRILDERLDLNGTGTTPPAKATSNELYGKRNSTECGDSCAGVTCNKTQECVDSWPTPFCRFNCFNMDFPCENGGVCEWRQPARLESFCNCTETKGYSGERCEILIPAMAGISWWWIVLPILLLLLLLLLLGLIYCCCCLMKSKKGKTEALVTQSEMEHPPEKLADYATQGAGEVDYFGAIDYSHLDLNKVKFGSGPNRDRPTPIPTPSFLQPPLSDIYDAPLDYPLEYAYEGRQNSPSISLSTIVDSVTTPTELDAPLDLRPLRDWGPQFAPISELYNPPRAN